VVAETRYLPYGEERWITGTLVTDFTFTGQRADSYIKLMEMGARWYDPQIGRWISPDTIIPDPTNPQSLNRYSYVYNNPVRYFDSDGYCAPFCYVAVYEAFRLLPRESLAFGSRQLAQTGIPIASDLAAWDAQTTDQLWQAIKGTDLEGNPLSTKERIDVGGEGYLNLLGEAATAVTVVEGVEVLWAVGKLAHQRATQAVERATGNAFVDDVLENELSNVRTTVKPTYDPTLTDAYGLSSRGEFSTVGQPSVQAGRLEVVDTIIHEEVHQRLWARGIPGPQHNEEHIWNVSRRFTRMKGLGVAPSQLQNIPE
jgi:RHS repeat-associated protein